MITYISELMIYTLISITLLFDLIIILDLSLFFWHQKNWQEKIIIDWKFIIINLLLMFLNYVLIVICCLILFVPSYFNILFFSYIYRDALFIVSLVLMFYFLLRYLILVTTINYCFFVVTKTIINLLTFNLTFTNVENIKIKSLVIVIKTKNCCIKNHVFWKSSKLGKQLLARL